MPKSNSPIITKKYIQCKIPHTFKIYVLELPDNKNIGKLFSKYDLFFPNQANFGFDSSQILILQHPILYLPFLLDRLYLTVPWKNEIPFQQSFSSSFLDSLSHPNLFNYTPQILDVKKHMSRQLNEIYYYATCRS